MLIQQGANVNSVDLGVSPLHRICSNTTDNHKMVKFLWRKVQTLVVVREESVSRQPLKTSSHRQQILLEHGAMVTLTHKSLEQAVCLKEDDTELVEIILQQLNRVFSDDEGSHLLKAATQSANEEIVKLLLSHGLRVFLFANCVIFFLFIDFTIIIKALYARCS